MNSKHSGFTLIELIIVLAIAAAVLTLGVPALRDLIRNNTRTAHVNDFVSTLNLARSEAIKRGVRVALCKSSDGATCNTSTCASGSNCWENGWIVFVDSDEDGTLDSGEQILKVHESFREGFTLRTDTNFSNWIAFLPDGLSRGASGPFANGTFNICDSRGVNEARFIAINTVGRILVRKYQTTPAGDTCP